MLAGAVVVLIAVFLTLEGAPALREIGPWRFVGDGAWRPTAGRFDLSAMIAGTAAVTLGAMLFAAPLGVGAAVFCRYYATPRLGRAYLRAIELLAGVPSVVFGLWGLEVLVPLVARVQPPGASLLTAAVVLALMILPTIALLAHAALAALPGPLVRSGAALGLSRWTFVRGVALPAAAPGIGNGLLLALGRALGETMAVLMVAGNVVELPGSVFDPVRTLTANIALEMGYATADHRSALFVSGLVLTLAVAALVGLASLLRRDD